MLAVLCSIVLPFMAPALLAMKGSQLRSSKELEVGACCIVLHCAAIHGPGSAGSEATGGQCLLCIVLPFMVLALLLAAVPGQCGFVSVVAVCTAAALAGHTGFARCCCWAWPLLQLDAPQLVHVRRPASALNPRLPACLHNFLSTALPQSKVAAFIRRVPGGTVVLNRVDKVSRGGVPGCSFEPQAPTLWRCFWCGWRRGSPSCCRTWMYSTQ